MSSSQYPEQAPPPSPMPGPKRLTRPRNDRMLSGVCAGLARYLDVDSTLVRVLAVIALVLTGFFPVGVVYLVAWALMPQE